MSVPARRMANEGVRSSALVVTLTPITVATTRDNLPDAILVLLMTLGAWGFLNALRTPRLRPLLVAAAMVGLAFNTKMLQAYLVVPAGVLIYFAAFKKHIGLFPPVRDEALLPLVAKYAGPKGNLQLPLSEPIPYALITKIVKARMKANRAQRQTKAGA